MSVLNNIHFKILIFKQCYNIFGTVSVLNQRFAMNSFLAQKKGANLILIVAQKTCFCIGVQQYQLYLTGQLLVQFSEVTPVQNHKNDVDGGIWLTSPGLQNCTASGPVVPGQEDQQGLWMGMPPHSQPPGQLVSCV